MGHRPGRWAAAAVFGTLLCAGPGRALGGSFVNFESGHVRPLALSPGGDQLFAVNTPDNRLAIYTVTTAGPGLTLAAEVPVGLEPVAVAARTNAAGRTEAWVVNHLSDSVSIVEVDPTDVTRSRVRRTLLVGDEPRDIVFAGPAKSRAFVTAAHRGQNRPGDPELTVEDKPRADVWVFDATDPGASALAGTPLVVLALKGDTPRALAATDDGATVYAAVFFSGNQTTTIPEPAVSKPIGPGLPPPSMGRMDGPDTGLIVRRDPTTGKWEDNESPTDWSNLVPFVLADRDVFVIDATASPPAPAAGTSAIRGVGTVLFNMAVRPGTSTVYVTNTEARNDIRFEPFVRAHIVDTRITVISGGVATPVDLNSHITYGTAEQIPGPASEVSQSIGLPLGMAFSPDGKIVYVAAFGSAKIAALDADKLETGTTKPRTLVPVGGGPTGLVVDAARDRLYVMNRFDHTISVVAHAGDLSQIGAGPPVSLRFTPEPSEVLNGRRFLYDATTTSAHGDIACATCHVFGDLDGLAWDLGDPTPAPPDPSNRNPFLGPRNSFTFHPMKGPMTTQSLRGMADAGPMHWRGDRSGGNVEISPGVFGDPLDETLAFTEFKGAFSSLLGGTIGTHMDAFTSFILTVRYPPNPIHALDNSMSAAEQRGRTFFTSTNVDGGTCAVCHVLPLGTDGKSSFDAEPQDFKMAHLRNLYAKIGRFGMPTPPSTAPGMTGNPFGIPGHTALGEQVRGFGFLHDGSVSSLDDFLRAGVFTFGPDPAMPPRPREDVAAFLLGFDTGLAPAVGQQVTVTSTSQADTGVVGRISLLLARANAGDCDLVAKGVLTNVPRGWVHLVSSGGNDFRSDRVTELPLPEPSLRAQAAIVGQEVTYTCVPPGSGTRIGVDRDEDGAFDGDELDAGTDPAMSPTTTSTTSTSSTSSTTSSTVPPCENGVRDGRETDVDCGGACCCPKGVLAKACRVYLWEFCMQASCKRCRGGQRCVCNSDCTSRKCEVVSIGPVSPGKLGVVRKCAPDVIPIPPNEPAWWWWLKGPGPLAVAADVVYVPAKLGLAAVGSVATGVTYVATLGDADAARTVWVTTTGGDYVVTPRMVAEGRMPQFLGDTTVEMSP